MKNRIVTIIGLFALLSTASAAGPKADFNVIPVPRTICAGTSAPLFWIAIPKYTTKKGRSAMPPFCNNTLPTSQALFPS